MCFSGTWRVLFRGAEFYCLLRTHEHLHKSPTHSETTEMDTDLGSQMILPPPLLPEATSHMDFPSTTSSNLPFMWQQLRSGSAAENKNAGRQGSGPGLHVGRTGGSLGGKTRETLRHSVCPPGPTLTLL